MNPNVSGPAARAEDLVKRYGSGPAAVTALAGASVEIPPGSFTAVMGPSGSGKSTCCIAWPGWIRRTRAGCGSAVRSSPRCRTGS